MSEEKFTKGDWRPIIEDYFIGVQMSTDGGFKIMVKDESTAKANANLIASAPEMYQMLKRLLTGGCLVYGEDIDSVEDLLAKARGES